MQGGAVRGGGVEHLRPLYVPSTLQVLVTHLPTAGPIPDHSPWAQKEPSGPHVHMRGPGVPPGHGDHLRCSPRHRLDPVSGPQGSCSGRGGPAVPGVPLPQDTLVLNVSGLQVCGLGGAGACVAPPGDSTQGGSCLRNGEATAGRACWVELLGEALGMLGASSLQPGTLV